MITDCFGGGTIRYLVGLDERAFFVDVLILIIVATPVTISYTLWRMLSRKRTSFNIGTVLGLDENSETYSESCGRRISWATLFLYALAVGVFAFEAMPYVQEFLISHN